MTEKIRDDANKAKLGGLVHNLKTPDRRLILSAKHTSSWLIIQGTAVIGTVITATEFRGCFCAHYNDNPPNLQNKCDG